MPIYLWKIAELYDECLQLVTGPIQWDTKLEVTCTHKPDILSVYCWHFIFFDFSFHNADVCIYLQKLLHHLIICSYKTNPSFSLCP